MIGKRGDNINSSAESYYDVPKNVKFMNNFNKVFKFLSDLFFTIILALLIVLLFYSFYTKKFGTNGKSPLISAYVIISPSMVPTVNVEDAVVAVRPSNKLKKNDVITFSSTDMRYTGKTVTHRILSVKNDGALEYQTKGDNNTTPDDAYVPFGNVIGKVILVIPWLGYVRFFLSKPIGWILVVAIPCIFLIIYDIFKLSKSLKENEKINDYEFKDVEVLSLDDDDENKNEDGDDNIEKL